MTNTGQPTPTDDQRTHTPPEDTELLAEVLAEHDGITTDLDSRIRQATGTTWAGLIASKDPLHHLIMDRRHYMAMRAMWIERSGCTLAGTDGGASVDQERGAYKATHSFLSDLLDAMAGRAAPAD